MLFKVLLRRENERLEEIAACWKAGIKVSVHCLVSGIDGRGDEEMVRKLWICLSEQK